MNKDKALGLFRLKLNGIMSTFAKYGLQDSIPNAQEEIVKAALEFAERLDHGHHGQNLASDRKVMGLPGRPGEKHSDTQAGGK